MSCFPARFSALLFSLCFLPVFLLAQAPVEDCTNGIDDDGDGLIDCYDQDCTCTGQCDSFYYTTCNADCYFIPPCDTLSLGIQWTSEAETGSYSPLVAGDMDKDGIPEVITYLTEGSDLYIMDGATGATKVHIVVPTTLAGGTAPAIADLDHDGYGEIVIVGNDTKLYCYEHDGTLKYAAGPVGYGNSYRFSVPNIADFDHDGWAEVNIGNQVYNGQTGALLASGGPGVSAGEHPARVANGNSFCSPVAIDALPDNFCPDCDGLEIVAGNQVLSVNLVTGAVVPVVTAPAGYSDGFTSIADFDRDGDLDAIVQGRKNGFNTVYCWDIQTPTIMHEFKLLNNWQEGASRVNIADLNGDGQLELSFVGFPWLYALKNDFTVMWKLTNNDASSITCSSVFDFCGDGSSDVIYRGQSFLQVLEGATGQVKWQDICGSYTHIENPLVLDVDADGQTEIVIECGANGTPDMGHVVAYEAVGTPGIASRKVWNQHAYFNTNINDDLSVPRYQQNPHIIGDSLKMNAFLNQFFNPTFPAPDGAISFQNVACQIDSLVLTIQVCNTGDNLLPPQTPVSAYLGNPLTTAAQWIGAVPIGAAISPDSCFTFSLTIPRLVSDSIFLVLNDDHSRPAPFSLSQDFPVTAIGECTFTDNIASFRFYYAPETLELGPDTLICDHTALTLDASGPFLLSYAWQDASADSAIVAPAPGTFSVTVTDVCGITQTDTRVVGVDSSTVVYAGPDRVICQGETAILGAQTFDFYQWSPASAVDCPTCGSVAAGPSATTMIVLQAGFNTGCVNLDSVLVTVNDTFQYTVDTTICYGRQVVWNNVTIPPDSSVTFALQTLQGCDSTVIIQVHGTTVGTFQVQVDTAVCLGKTLPYNGFDLMPGDQKTVFLSAITGCDSTVQIMVAPKDTFATSESMTICGGETIPIFGQPIGTSGVYRMTFAAQNGCDSTHTFTLSVLPELMLALDATPSCGNDPTGTVMATVSGGTSPFSYGWNIPDADTPTLTDLPAGNYVLTVTDVNNCTETASTEVTAFPPIEFEVTTDSALCFGQQNGALHILPADSTVVFSLDGSNFSQNLDYENIAAGPYEVTGQDLHGCVETIPAEVGQPAELLLDLPADTTIQLGDSLTLNIFLPNANNVVYTWENTAYLSCTSCPNPTLLPLTDISYALTVTDANGCSASDQMLITVKRIIGVFVPNAFNPKAQFDENSRFDVSFGPAVRRIELLQVFDRWGELVHEYRDFLPGDPAAAWDGTRRGKAVAPGVYVWQIELELVDGTKQKFRGDVTIIR